MDQFRKIPLGAKPDRQNSKDLYKSKRYSAQYPPELPASYILPYLPPIKDQKQTSSCTGHAASYFAEIILATRSNQFVKFSPFYVWYFGRLEEGVQAQDTGIQMRTIMDALHNNGVCPEEIWPAGSDIAKEPSDTAKLTAAFKLPVYERCETLQDIKYSLAIEKQPVCIGVEVFDSWYDPSVQGTGIIKYIPNQKPEGGHAICIVGYSDIDKTFKIANSWGPSYGDNGFIYISYDYLNNTWWDAWTAGYDTLPQI